MVRPFGSSDPATYLEDGRCSFSNNLSENAIRQVEILPNKLLTTAFEASLGCVAVM